MILPLYVALEKIDRRLIEAATDLYASRWQAFWRVTFTLSLPGVVAGSLLTFIPAIGDFINAEVIGAGNPEVQMIGNVIQFKYINANDYPAAAALSFVLVIGVTVLVARLQPRGRHRSADDLMGDSARCPASRCIGVHRPGRGVPVRPDRRDDRLQLQRPRRAARTSRGRASRSRTTSTSGAGRRSPGRWSPACAVAAISTMLATTFGTMIALGAGALRVPRPRRAEPADLHPDDGPGDHPRRVAADAVDLDRRAPRIPHHPRSRTSCSTSATWW